MEITFIPADRNCFAANLKGMENKYCPALFYVVFGTDADKLAVSRQKHHVDCVPEGLNMRRLDRNQHQDYMENLLSGTIVQHLQKNHLMLYEACRDTTEWVILEGKVTDDGNLGYLRNTIGIIQACIEQGSVGVLDLFTIELYSASDWTSRYFNQEINPQTHVIILKSDDGEGSYWLHTRGMIKFGRPDFSLHRLPETGVEDAVQALNQLIFHSGKGQIVSDFVRLHTFKGKIFEARLQFVPDFENFDFNNAYYEVTLKEGESGSP